MKENQEMLAHFASITEFFQLDWHFKTFAHSAEILGKYLGGYLDNLWYLKYVYFGNKWVIFVETYTS